MELYKRYVEVILRQERRERTMIPTFDLDMLTKADNQSMAKAQADHPSTNQTINGNKRISLRLQARAARGSSDQVRIGKSYDTRRQKDKDQFTTDMKEKKWQRQIDMMKK